MMLKWIFPLLAIIAGIAISSQASINSGLGKKIGAIEGSLISFAVGTLSLLFASIYFGKGNLFALIEAPKWQLTGGLLGAVYVLIIIIVVPKIGVATTVTSVILGQIIMSIIIDHFGLFDSKQISFDLRRVIALLLLLSSLFLFYKK